MIRSLSTWACLVGCLVASASPVAGAGENARAIVERAKAEAVQVPAQAEALARLAWPEEGPGDPEVMAIAREQLVGFGHLGIPALRSVVKRAAPLYTADVTAALVSARYRDSSGMPQDYLPGLVDCIWYGSSEGRRIAILEIARYRFPLAVPTIIDSVHQFPELSPVAMRTLGRMGDGRAKVFLSEALLEGSPRYRGPAALALAGISDGVDVLRDALGAKDDDTSAAALRALLPRAGTDDLTLLYNYVDLHGSEDPELLRLARDRAMELELELEREQDQEGASTEAP